MKDSFGRTISYLRVSVTDRCNLRCQYCLPKEGIAWLEAGELLSYEEIADVVRVGSELGINKVRITGGEPLVRRDVARLVAMLAAIPGIRDLAMSTNGILLAGHARALAQAGLSCVRCSTASRLLATRV